MQNRLKPMGIRDILDTTFTIMRERFWTFKLMIIKAFLPSTLVFTGMLLISLAYLLIVSSIIKIPIIDPEFWRSFFQKTLISSIIMVVFQFLLLLGFIVALNFGGIYFTFGSIKLYKTALHNEACPSKEVFVGIKGKRLKIFLIHFLIGIIFYILSIPGVIATMVVMFINPTLGQVVSYLNRILVFVLELFVCLAPIIAVIEDLEIAKTITRAFQLPAKHRWRMLGTLILVYLLALVIMGVFTGLLAIPIMMAVALKNIVAFLLAGVLSLVIIFFFMVFMSFGYGPLVAMYYDLIIRKEGYDLQLQITAGEPAPDSTIAGWSQSS